MCVGLLLLLLLVCGDRCCGLVLLVLVVVLLVVLLVVLVVVLVLVLIVERVILPQADWDLDINKERAWDRSRSACAISSPYISNFTRHPYM